MHKRISTWWLRLAGLACVFAVATGAARAAGEWEWTAGQGWVMGAGVSRPTAKEQLHYAYELEQRGEFMDASRQYFLLVQNFPESQEAGIGLQRLARCLFEMENYYTSYKAIEQVIETYPNTGRMSDLVEIELRIAKKMMVSETPDILSGRSDGKSQANVRRALEIVDSVIEHDPYGPVAAEAYLVKGEGHLFIGEISAARTAFNTVLDEFPRSDFVQRARVGVTQCDNLVGQASPQELQEQLELLREMETQRREEDGGRYREELDDVDGTIRKLAEVEAAKMLEQAEQYRRMGTRDAVNASKFLYNEIIRRFPGSPQSDQAHDRLGTVKDPKEQGRLAKTFRNIKFNPFSWNKDPEPPWVVPQLDPEDAVMVDSGLGPILGVPETGIPQTAASAGVRPHAMPEGSATLETAAVSATGGDYVDGVSGTRTYTSDGGGRLPVPPPAAPRRPNPLPTISDDDLIPLGGSPAVASTGRPASSYGGGGQPLAPLPELGPSSSPQPMLNSRDYNTPYSDLVGPTRRLDAPLPEYDYTQPYGQQPPANQYDPYSYQAPQPAYQQPQTYYQQPQPTYQDPYYQQPAYDVGGQLPAAGYGTTNGGWTLGEDFR